MTEWKDYVGKMAKIIIWVSVTFFGLVVVGLIVSNILWWIIYEISTRNLDQRIREDQQIMPESMR